MKLNEIAFANASAALIAIIYVVCALLVALFPGFSKEVSQSWFHGLDLSLIWTGESRGNFLMGLVTAIAGTWLTGWLFAWLYNNLVKAK